MSSDTPTSTARPGVDLDPRVWETLFSLARKEADDRRVLERQLRSWCIAWEVGEAGLYTADEGRLRLRARAGRGKLPEELPAVGAAKAVGEGRAVLELPEALLVYRQEASETELRSDADLLLLAAGARISALKRQIHDHSFQAMFRGVELEVLYDVGLAIASTLDLDQLYDEVLLRAVSLLDARRGALYLLEDGRYRLTSRFGGSALESFAADQVRFQGDDCRGPDGWLPEATHLLAVPVEIEGDLRGVLVVADKESRRGVGPFPSNDRRTLKLFANQAAIALENAKLHRLALEKERLEREMELAAEIQSQLLPEVMPEIPGYEVVGWNRPARQVGGDYFELSELDGGRWGLVVGDVTGKGLPAALLVSTLHSALRLLLDRMEVGPPLVERLNRHVYESSGANKFITMLMAALEPETARLHYVNAGHNPGLLIRRGGEVEELGSSGLPLGLLPGADYTAATVELGEGDLLCLYSDGITECESPEGEEFELDRLRELLEEHRDHPLPEIVQAIDRAVTDFAAGLPQGDDQTVVLLRRCG